MRKTITKSSLKSRFRFTMLSLAFFWLMIDANTGNAQVVVGTGSTSNLQRFPFSFWYGYSRDATIYTAAELNTVSSGGTVTTLSWKSSISSSIVAPVVIYLKEVGSTTAVASDTWANTIVGATQVYSGTPANWVIGWNTIDISDYNISAGQNLEVLVECAYGSSGGGGQTGTQFTCTTLGSNTHGYWQKDTNPPVGVQSADGGGIDAKRPDISFGGLVAADMAYSSSTTTQSSTSTVAPGSVNQQMVRLEIGVSGASNPLSVSQLNFNTGNTNVPANISNAKVYYTGESSVFSTTNQFGSTVNSPSGAFSVNGSQTLNAVGMPNTTFYFWLTYDVSCSGISASDSLDAVCSSFTINSGSQTPTVTNPTGTRAISIPSVAYTATTSTSTSVGASNLTLGRINITGDNCNTLVTSVQYNTASSPVADISQAKCYYTAGSTFNADSLFGSPVLNPSGNIVFNGSKSLATGSGNNFWIVYDISCNAGTLAGVDSVVAVPVSLTTNANTYNVATPSTNAKKKVNAQTAPAYTATTTTSASVGTMNVPLGRISITGDICNAQVTSVKYNTDLSMIGDISEARCYYTTSTTFGTDSLFGSAIIAPNGDMVFNGSKTLAAGSGNYFWIAYSISCSAGTIAGVDSVVAVPVSITTNSSIISVATPSSNAKKGIVAASGFSTVADGDWSAPSTWACGALPTGTADVTINNVVTITTSGNVAANVTIASGKSLTISSGDLTMGASGGDNKVFTNNGTLTVSGGTFNINGQFVNAANATFNQSGGNINVDPNASGSGTSVTGSGNYPINLTFTTAANANLTGGVFTLVDPPSASSSSAYAMYVTYSPVGSLAAGPNHTFRFGDGISTDAGGTTGFRYYSWNGSGVFKFGKLILEANPSNAASRFVFINGTFFNLSATDDIVIKSGAELRQTGTAMTGAIFVGKNLTVEPGGTLTVPGIIYFGNVTSTSSTALAGSVTSNAQTITGAGATFRNSATSSTANFAQLTINNNNATGVTFADASSLLSGANTGTVSGTLTLTAGNVNVGSNTLVLGISSSTTGTYSYTAGMINGKFKRWLGASTGSRTFDIGSASGSKQVTINFTTAPSSGGSLTATFSATNPGNAGLPLTDGSTTYTNASASGYWTVSVGDGLSGGVYSASFRGTGFNDVADYNTLTLGKRNTSGDDWTLVGTHVAPTGSNGNFVVLRTGISGFSDFGILSSVEPLEVKLLSFNGYNAGKANILNWETVSEKNFRFFELQRSADASKFVSIAKIDGKNTGGGKYQYEDESPLSGRNFYRLKMVDINGNAVISKVIEVSSKTGNTLIVSAHPNPVKQLLQINIEGAMDVNPGIQIFDIVGKLILTVKPTGNNTNIDMSSVADGTYIVRYTDNSHSYTTKIRKN